MRHTSLGLGRSALLAAIACVFATGCDRDTRPGQLGKAAPVFSVADGHTSVDLAKFRGRVVLLNFWASWCAPCIEEMPSLQALQSQLPQVQVIAVASDEDYSQYQSYLQQQHIHLLTVFDSAQHSNAMYGSFRFPETYIIDKQGVVRRKLIGAQDFTDPAFIAYLKQLAS